MKVMVDPISDTLNGIMGFFNKYYAIILVLFGGLFLLMWWLSKGEKEPKYKPIVLEKEIQKNLTGVFNLTKENIGFGKTLFIGSRDAGFVLKSVLINQYPSWEDTGKKGKLDAKYPESKELMDKGKVVNILHGFETCGRGRINRLKAYFGIGVDIYLVDAKLVEINEQSININAYSKPVKMFGVWIFSNWGKEELEEIAFKLNHEQMLEQFVNIIPKSIFLGDVEAGKEKATFDMLEQANSDKRKEQLEQIKKA